MPATIQCPTIVKETLEQSGHLFANKPERVHFAEYLTGLIAAYKKLFPLSTGNSPAPPTNRVLIPASLVLLQVGVPLPKRRKCRFSEHKFYIAPDEANFLTRISKRMYLIYAQTVECYFSWSCFLDFNM